MIVKSLVRSVCHVWSMDPALDTSADGFADRYKAAKESGKAEDFPTREGARPTVFKIAPLSRKVFMRLGRFEGLEKINEIVACGVKGVDAFEVDGVPFAAAFDEVDGVQRLNVRSLDAFFDLALFAELSDRIIEISMLPTSPGRAS